MQNQTYRPPIGPNTDVTFNPIEIARESFEKGLKENEMRKSAWGLDRTPSYYNSLVMSVQVSVENNIKELESLTKINSIVPLVEMKDKNDLTFWTEYEKFLPKRSNPGTMSSFTDKRVYSIVNSQEWYANSISFSKKYAETLEGQREIQIDLRLITMNMLRHTFFTFHKKIRTLKDPYVYWCMEAKEEDQKLETLMERRRFYWNIIHRSSQALTLIQERAREEEADAGLTPMNSVISHPRINVLRLDPDNYRNDSMGQYPQKDARNYIDAESDIKTMGTCNVYIQSKLNIDTTSSWQPMESIQTIGEFYQFPIKRNYNDETHIDILDSNYKKIARLNYKDGLSGAYNTLDLIDKENMKSYLNKKGSPFDDNTVKNFGHLPDKWRIDSNTGTDVLSLVSKSIYIYMLKKHNLTEKDISMHELKFKNRMITPQLKKVLENKANKYDHQYPVMDSSSFDDVEYIAGYKMSKKSPYLVFLNELDHIMREYFKIDDKFKAETLSGSDKIDVLTQIYYYINSNNNKVELYQNSISMLTYIITGEMSIDGFTKASFDLSGFDIITHFKDNHIKAPSDYFTTTEKIIYYYTSLLKFDKDTLKRMASLDIYCGIGILAARENMVYNTATMVRCCSNGESFVRTHGNTYSQTASDPFTETMTITVREFQGTKNTNPKSFMILRGVAVLSYVCGEGIDPIKQFLTVKKIRLQQLKNNGDVTYYFYPWYKKIPKYLITIGKQGYDNYLLHTLSNGLYQIHDKFDIVKYVDQSSMFANIGYDTEIFPNKVLAMGPHIIVENGKEKIISGHSCWRTLYENEDLHRYGQDSYSKTIY